MSNLVFLFPRRCAPLIAPSSRFATPNPSFQKEGTTWLYQNANCHIIIQEEKGFLKPKPRHEWQVVAEALHVAGTEKVAAGLTTAIGFIVFQEERSIEDDALYESIGHRG